MTATIADRKVINCYSGAGVTVLAGVNDYTDGVYFNNPQIPYEQAKRNQHIYLLDEVGATRPDFRLLDVGCGLGTLLKVARERGVQGIGITISEEQVALCRAEGLDVQLFNYRLLPDSWKGKFDGIIANGSLEHFCQPTDARMGNQDTIYKEMFWIFKGLLDPNSPHGKVATTAIHFRSEHFDPVRFGRSPFQNLFSGGEAFHFSVLNRGYGGYYPSKGQLQNCALDYFELEKEEDGTQDYNWTSEEWCWRLKHAFWHNPAFRRRLLRDFLRHPVHEVWGILSHIGLESWPWQFRGTNPPTRLYRHTWQMVR